MPRSTFSNSMLGGMAPGLSRLAGSLAGKDQAYQSGYDQADMTQGRIAQMLAQMGQSNAQADKAGADAEKTRYETSILQRRPDQLNEQAALASGTDLPLVRLIRESLAKGEAPQMAMQGPTEDGSELMGEVDPGKVSAVKQALMRFAPIAMNSSDMKIDDWAKAQGAYRDADLGDQVLAGQRTAGAVGASQAAVAGKSLYNSDASGAVLDLFGGGLNTSNPMAQSTIALKGEQAGAQRANAVQSYAAADNSRASAAETRAGSSGGGKAPTGYRWGAGGSLEPIPGGPAAKENTSSEGERKAGTLLMRLRGSQAQMLAAVGQSPNSEKPIMAAEFVRSIGGDTPANLMTDEARQQVEAAQLDMLDAALTLGTGAAYTKEQLRGYAKSFFPQIGDQPKTLADKRVRLANVIRSAEIAAGRSAKGAAPSPLAGPGAARESGPAPGAVVEGYRFKGGNPADPAAWEKL